MKYIERVLFTVALGYLLFNVVICLMIIAGYEDHLLITGLVFLSSYYVAGGIARCLVKFLNAT